MTHPTLLPPAPARPTPWYLRLLYTLAACGALVAVAALARPVWGQVAGWATGTPTAVAAPLPDDDPPPKDPQTPTAPQKSAAAARYEGKLRTAEQAAADTHLDTRIAAAKAAQKVLTELGGEVNRVLDEAAAEADRWDKEVPLLLTNDAGKAVASKPDAAKAFRALHALERPGRSDVAKVRGEVEALLVPVDKAFKDPNNVWDKTADAERRLSALLAQAKVMRDTVRNRRTQIDSLVTVSKRDGRPGDMTLQEAIHVFVHEESLEAAALITKSRDEARRETDRVMAETLGEADRRAGQTAARTEAAKAEAARIKADAEADNKLKQAAKDRLREKAKSPEVQKDLAVFLAKGYSQPRAGGSGFFDKTSDSAPVSFNRLQTGGYLDETTDGLKKLLRLGAEPNFNNDRPKWGYNHQRLDLADQEFLKRVQAQLRELGPVLVEEGLLSK